MSYTNYAAEADEHRKTAARCYYESRKEAKDADKNYRTAANYRRMAEFYTHFRQNGKGSEHAASFEKVAWSTLRLADVQLNSSFNSMNRARFYAQLARDYDELAERRAAR